MKPKREDPRTTVSLAEAAEAYSEAMRLAFRRNSLLYLVQGGVLILAGAFAILYPLISATAVIVMLGWLLIASGVTQGVGLIGALQVPQTWFQLISVALAVFIGFLFLLQPTQGILSISLLLVVFFMVEGISKIMFSLAIRPFPMWAWLLASGVVGVLLSAILLMNLASATVWLLGLLLGVHLISVGSAMGYLALNVRRGPEAA
jgi:uncharacterized membrane protein HdeD (DUF308 family)